MAKAMIIVDVPDDVANVNLSLATITFTRYDTLEVITQAKEIKHIPQKRELPKEREYNYELSACIKGYNECIERILEKNK